MRFNLKSTLIFIALLNGVAFTSKGHAGDLPKRNSGPAFTQPHNQLNWRGFYVGLHGNYGWGRARSADLSGFAGGVQAGYNWQFDNVVAGVEGDISASNVGYRGFADTFQQKWQMTARGRIGYSVDRFLPYLTGGFAYSSNRMKAGGGRADEGQAGYVIGVGAEVMLMQNVSARVEVLHHYYGSKSYVLPIGARSTTLTSNALRFGLNYKF